jgi:hypothetical protein
LGAIGDIRSFDGLWRGRVVYIRVLPCGAGLNGKEFVESKHAGFAAFPACNKSAFAASHVVVGHVAPTFLAFMEDGRAWMVNALVILVLISFAAAFVHALLGHVCSMWSLESGVWRRRRSTSVYGCVVVLAIYSTAPNILEGSRRHVTGVLAQKA